MHGVFKTGLSSRNFFRAQARKKYPGYYKYLTYNFIRSRIFCACLRLRKIPG